MLAAVFLAVSFNRVTLMLLGVAAGAITIRGFVSRVNRLGNPHHVKRPSDVPDTYVNSDDPAENAIGTEKGPLPSFRHRLTVSMLRCQHDERVRDVFARVINHRSE